MNSAAGSNKRGGKSKVPLPASNTLFALGGSTDSSSGIGQKRGPPLSNKDPLISAKRPKVFKRQSGEWEDNIIEIDNEHLLKRIIEAENNNDESRVEKYICGAIRKLRNNRIKPDSILFLCLTYLAKTRPQHFLSENVIDALCSILKKDPTPAPLKSKSSDLAPILAANILWATHQNELIWPLSFVEAFIEDSLATRVWVDSDACKPFVLNILTAFNTKSPPKNLLSQDILMAAGAGTTRSANDSPASTSPTHVNEDSIDETSSSSIFPTELRELKEKFNDGEVEVLQRYSHNQNVVIDYVIETVNEQLNRRLASSEINRNVFKLLMSTVGIPQIRLVVAQRLEIWLQNPKLSRPAQDLLLTACINCTKDDIDVVSALVKMRLKTKPLMNHFMLCIKEFLNQGDDSLMVIMRNVITNEISSTRGSNNMQLLAVMFQYAPAKATKCLALLIHEFLVKDDYLRQTRVLLREIVRTLRHDHLGMPKLVSALTEDNSRFVEIDSQEVLTRILTSLADIIPLCMFLIISPSVKESLTKPERKDILRQTQNQISEIQRLSIIWMQKVVMKVFKPERNEFMHCFNKCLIMERAEHYYDKDNWPPESERNLFFRLTTEVPAHEDSLIRVLKMGLSKDYPLQSTEAIELTDALIKRAAASYDGDPLCPTLCLKKEELFNLLLKSTIYRIPENIVLPSGYEPPQMSIIDCYWKVWIQLLIITAYNSSKFGLLAWENYPTLALLIEMCITNKFEFPPVNGQSDDLKSNEMQIAAAEKSQILQFESHLAAASSKRQITEANSLLLSKLITFDPHGKPRHPPGALLEDLKNLNIHLRLGYLLCQSRNPDFLLEIIQRQQKQALSSPYSFGADLGTMQWLNDLIEMNSDNLASLPVQGLSEFTLRYVNEEEQLLGSFNDLKQIERNRRKEKRRKFCKLLSFFNESLIKDPIVTKQVFDYFLRRLCSPQASLRSLSAISLNLILYYDDNMIENLATNLKSHPETWLIGKLPTIAYFENVKKIACSYLRSAILVETDSEAICCYVQFLAEFGVPGDKETLLDISRLIIDRAVTFKFLTKTTNYFRDDFLSSCIKLFYDYIELLGSSQSTDQNSATSLQDHLLIKWFDGTQAVLHILIVQAIMVLLTYDPPQNKDAKKQWEKLILRWFSHPMPTCYLASTAEEALLLPDWLKLKLLKCPSPILVEAALKDSDLSQLLLFIQSFGIPVPSMERILQALDYASETDPETVRVLVRESSFLHQIVEVQFMRGVQFGKKFAELIGLPLKQEELKPCDLIDPFSLAIDSF